MSREKRVSIATLLLRKDDRPVLLTLVYHNCPMLCNNLLDGATTSLSQLEWTAGEEFEMITLSIAPDETPELAAEKKAAYLQKLGKMQAGTGWHFLTGNETEIQKTG